MTPAGPPPAADSGSAPAGGEPEVGEGIAVAGALAVIFALLAFAQVFEFTGVLLALPASAAILVALRHMRAAYDDSALYRDQS